MIHNIRSLVRYTLLQGIRRMYHIDIHPNYRHFGHIHQLFLMVVHPLLPVILLVNRKISRGNVFNNIWLDSEGTTETGDMYTVSQRLRSTRSANDYDLAYPAFSKSNETIDGYRSPIQVDPFARPINTDGRHHYRKLPNAQKYVLITFIKHDALWI